MGHLGTGGYGKVLQCRWQGAEVALKVMHSHKLASVEAFIREARLMSVLRHPNIVQFLGVCMKQGKQGVRQPGPRSLLPMSPFGAP